MADLVAAGAPELLPGWFYRVTPDGLGGLEVQVRERRKWVGSRRHATALVLEGEPDGLKAIVRACRHAARLLEEELRHRSCLSAAGQYIGDHDAFRGPKWGTR
ncbi:hypothetical protein AB0I84_45285 [Streptomyces spectabilis]|uniref:hypothetical protein n=1 Tax=Streptomyces spectabilis TaxID=68270 RepID=UPI00340429A9